MRARHKVIEIAHYRATVHVVVGRDLAAAYALARRLEPQLAETAGDDEKGACVVVAGSPWMLLPMDASPGVAAHEAVPAAVALAEQAGLPVAAAADEVLAYLVEAVVDAVAPWLARLAQSAQ